MAWIWAWPLFDPGFYKFFVIGASLSKPHINGLCAAGCYDVTYVGAYFNFSLWARMPGTTFIRIRHGENGCRYRTLQIFLVEHFK